MRPGAAAPVLVLLVPVVLAVAGCAAPKPRADATLGPAGGHGTVGVDAGAVSAGVSSSGAVNARAKVVDTSKVDVSVGTGGAALSLGKHVGVNKNGVRFRL